ncbi:unnamed protein product [Urochloa humidicola]
MGTAAAGAKGTTASPPPSEGTAGAFQSPASFTGTSTFYSQFPSATSVGGSMNGAFWTQSFGGSPDGHPSMRHQAFDPSIWDNDPIPPGGFTNLINNRPQVSQNHHLVGGSSHFVPFKPPRPFDTSPSLEETTTPHSSPINVDSGDEAVRTEKRILWTQEEDVRLMSSWLLNSTDSSQGADRKNEHYWDDVIATYNETTPGNRKRNLKQAKDRWHKINRWTNLFNDAWIKARHVLSSGYNEQMWIEKAHVFYIEDNKKLKLPHFVLMDVWKIVRNEAKWITYNNVLKQARKRKSSDKENEEEDMDCNADQEDVEELPRPMGQQKKKKAKKAALEKKGANANGKIIESIDLEEMNTFGKIQADEHANTMKCLKKKIFSNYN